MAGAVNKRAERTINDAGEKIGGSRADQWRERFMTASDLDDMTAAERAAHVTKDNVWPPPDFSRLVKDGMPAKVAALVKIIRDRTAAKPALLRGSGPEASARAYVHMLGLMRDELLGCRTEEAVAGVANRLYSRVGWVQNRHDEAVRRTLFSIFKGRTGPFHTDREDLKKAAEMVAAGFPEAIPSWRRHVKLMGSPGYFSLWKGNRPIERGFATEDAAWEWLKTQAEAAASAKEPGAQVGQPRDPKRPHLDRIVREGPDHREGRSVTSEDFLDAFGFRGVEFGLWLPDDERQQVLDAAYDALHDLADALGIPPRGVSLDGTLAVAFGARGSGSAAAHYEPGRTVINMTRLRGAGFVAHEWGHALDHWVGLNGHVDELEEGQPRYASGGHEWRRGTRGEQLPRLSPELRGLVDRVMMAMRKAPMTRGEAIAKVASVVSTAKVQIARDEAELAGYLERTPEAKRSRKFLTENAAHHRWWTERAHAAGQKIVELREAPDATDFGNKDSAYFTAARAMSGKSPDGYWQRPTEMFARAMEAMVYDRIQALGRRSDYLVHSVSEASFAGPQWKGNPYPLGEERARLTAVLADAVTEAARQLDPAKLATPARRAEAEHDAPRRDPEPLQPSQSSVEELAIRAEPSPPAQSSREPPVQLSLLNLL